MSWARGLGLAGAGFALGVGLALAAGAVALGGLYWWARAPICEPMPREDLSLREMAQLNRRLERARRPSDEPLTLSAREASFLVREQFGVPAWVGVEDDLVHLELRVADGGGCWNVSYLGEVSAEARRVVGVPRSLRVGALDLSVWVRGREVALDAVVDAHPRLAEVRQHLTSLRVRDGAVEVAFDDLRWLP